GDAEGPAEKGLGGGGAETDEDVRMGGGDLGVEPGAAGGDLARVGLLVDAALAAGFPLEVLDDVGDVDAAAVDARLGQCAIEQAAGRTDEGTTREVFLVARLL